MRLTAKIISYLFHPIFLPSAGLIMVFALDTFIRETTPFAKQFFIVVWIFINTAVIPLIFTLFLKWRGVVDSIQLHSREERIVPFTFALLFHATNYWLMRDMALPPVILSVFLGSSVAVACALAATFFTKISIHMIGMGGITAALFGMAQIYQLPITMFIMLSVLASGAVGSARFILESHNLRQIYLGWGVGFFAVYLTLLFN